MSDKILPLSVADLQYLVELLLEVDAFLDNPRGFLTLIGLPRRYVNSLTLPVNNPRALAQTVVSKLAYDYGRFPEPPYQYALYALLEHLETYGLDQQHMKRLDEMILRYKLVGLPLIGPEDEALLGQPERWKKVSFLLRGAQAIRAVCRVDLGTNAIGTGFLLANDLVLTNYHVLSCGSGSTAQEKAVSLLFRFGYLEENGVLRNGETFSASPAPEALVAWSEHRELDFALIKLQKGVAAFGYLKPVARALATGEEISVVQHPAGWDMKFSIGLVEGGEAGRVYYRAITLKGSSGSPVFDQEWNLLALHQGTDNEKQLNRGVPMTEILPKIQRYLPD